MRDIISGAQHVHLGTLTLSGVTPNASSWIDLQGFDGGAIMIYNGTVTAAGSGGYTATAQVSDLTTAVSAVTIPASDSVSGATAVAQASPASNTIGGVIGYNGPRRYLRFNMVGTSGTNAIVHIFGIARRAHREPTTFIGASVAAT